MNNNFVANEMTDEFWKDCTDGEATATFEQIDNFIPYNEYAKNYGRNNNQKKNTISKNAINLYSFQNQSKNEEKSISKNKSKNKTIENPNFSRIYKNHPLLKKYKINSEIENKQNYQKKKEALVRCLGLYAYGIEVKKEKLMNQKNILRKKISEERLKCPFKPKINKYSLSKKAKFLSNFINKNNTSRENKNSPNNVYKITTLSSYDNPETGNNNRKKNIYEEEKNSKLEDYTFKPKTTKLNTKTVFSKSKSMEIERYNNIFILRYNKAREDYMVKKIKKLSYKDECYETLVTELNEIKYLNRKVHNTIDDYKNFNSIENKNNVKLNKALIQLLRNELLDIDLNGEE